jgi:exopolysaccharide biosynthesis polyprenyl glycosylphosphotransferase
MLKPRTANNVECGEGGIMSVGPEELRSRPEVGGHSRQDGASGAGAVAVRDERRRHNSPKRQSWASAQPFVPPAPAGRPLDPVERAEVRRSRWTRPMLVRAVLADFLLATSVIGLCTASLNWLRPIAPLVGLLGALVWVAAVLLARGYEVGRMGDGAEEFQAILRAAFGVVMVLGVISYAFQVLLPRREVLVAVPLVTVLSAISRYTQRRRLHQRRYRGDAMLRTLVVGEPVVVQRLAEDLRDQASHGFDVVGACLPVPGPEVEERVDVAVLGSMSEVPQVVVDHDVDSVIVVGSLLSGLALRRLSWALERTGAQLLVEPGLVEVAGPNVQLRPAAGLSLLHLEKSSSRSGRMLGKAVLDRVLGTFLLLGAAPVILAAALAVRLTSRGSAIFRQPRMGVDGSTFTMYKIRTMVVDAEARRGELLDHSNRDGLMFKMRSDPRVTRVGAVLRRFSVDELPQLLNVVRGDMSLVGPRPPLASEYEQYHDAVHRRLRVRPGLTGLWQVSGRADLTWDESVRLDLRYVDNWSLALDLLILWKTARAVVGRSGAY